jgi:hydrogenase maturation protein HypF
MYKYHIYGIVQGVGFRPFVSKLAHAMDIRGAVRNTVSGAEIFIDESETKAESFIEAIKSKLSPEAEIVRIVRDSETRGGTPATPLVPNSRPRIEPADKPPGGSPATVTSGGNGPTAGRPLRRPRDGFTILPSSISGDIETNGDVRMLPPDIGICDECVAEFFDPANRRHKHPFISCQKCGPRYSITERFPYDRPNTSMSPFAMCAACASEYGALSDRRHHAQTISCHDCPPYVIGTASAKGEVVPPTGGQTPPVMQENRPCVPPPLSAPTLVKGISGYHLAAPAKNEAAVALLRKIKNRDAKPFALMFKTVDEIREYCEVSPEEEAALRGRERQIVLLRRRCRGDLRSPATGGSSANASVFASGARGEEAGAADKPIAPNVYGDSKYLGCMLPSMGLHYLLLEEASPLVMTSANLSGMPVVYKDEDAFAMMERSGGEIGGIVYNERKIIIGQDDSVVKIQNLGAGKTITQIIRRSKGYAPIPIAVEAPPPPRRAGDLRSPANVRGEEVFAAAGTFNPTTARGVTPATPIPHSRAGVEGDLWSPRNGNPCLKRADRRSAPTPIYPLDISPPDNYAEQNPPLKMEQNEDRGGNLGGFSPPDVFASGADMKSAFAFLKGGFCYLSQFLGEHEGNIETEENYLANYRRMRDLFGFREAVVAVDMHPAYVSRRLGLAIAEAANLRVIEVQHHHAHIASVIAEHGLAEPVIGVAFDGTGYGGGNIWGGEILICEGAGFKRFSHLAYADMPGGDLASVDASLPASAYFSDFETRITRALPKH